MGIVVRILPTFVAALCALAFLPWLMGVPGTDNDYARGWTIGFFALVYYLCLYILVMILKLVARMGWLPLRARWLDQMLLAAVAGFVVAQIVAFTLILR